jgi:hypothetical protein
MTNQIEPFTGQLPEGWSGGEPVTKHWNGNFVHLYRVRRSCKTCQAEIRIDVTKAALQGFKKNAGLLLRNCPTCREARKGGVGSRGGTSRPVAPDAVQHAPAVVDVVTDETLRTINRTLEQEIDGLNMLLREANARLAKYELQPALREASRMPWE